MGWPALPGTDPAQNYWRRFLLLVRTYIAPSPIEGIGVFAMDPIRAGQAIWRFVPGFDLLLPPDFLHQGDIKWITKYTQTCEITGMLLLCADNMRFMNHSDNPNVNSTKPLFHGSQTDDALRDIAAGEELTCDYRLAEEHPFKSFHESSLHDKDLAAELYKVAEKMRCELLQIGFNRGPDLVAEAAGRLERRRN